MLETDALVDVLRGLPIEAWERSTPSEGWVVRDQISHLAYFDEVTCQAATDPAAFEAERARVADIDGFTGEVAARFRSMPAAELLDWFGRARRQFVETFARTGPSERIPWYGQAMSAASAVTARIMETWAHGQDVVDAVHGDRRPTPALRQVAHIGVRALPNSFRAHGLEVPDVDVRVELTGPDGDVWIWGGQDATDSVRGPAVDFCLVATRRRHVDDTSLEATGPVATTWLTIAQAFAGPPGSGRKPVGRSRPG